MLLVRTVASRRVVASACARSRRAGVRPGMVLADARALLRREPIVAPDEPERDDAALLALARWATRWAPIVNTDPPDGLVLDVGGCEHLFGGERALARSLLESLGRIGLTARAGVACTPAAARALARFAPHSPAFVDPGRERQALETFPVECLRLEPAALRALADVGVRRVGQLLALPRSALPARYGPEALRRIDLALGAAFEPLERLPDEVRFEAGIDLPGGTTDHRTLTLAARQTLERLAEILARRQAGARRVELRLRRIDQAWASIDLHLGRPARNAAHLWTLARPRLERLHLGFGVERVEARAGLVAPLPHEQAMLQPRADPSGGRHAGGADEHAWAQTLDTIANRIGRGRVVRAAVSQRYAPERAFEWTPALGGATPPGVEGLGLGRARPSKLLERPEPVRVMALSPDGPVVRVWRAGGGSEGSQIVASQGPERLGGEWWRAREGHRDYFRVQERSGRWLWIFREGGAWFIHGEWA